MIKRLVCILALPQYTLYFGANHLISMNFDMKWTGWYWKSALVIIVHEISNYIVRYRLTSYKYKCIKANWTGSTKHNEKKLNVILGTFLGKHRPYLRQSLKEFERNNVLDREGTPGERDRPKFENKQ